MLENGVLQTDVYIGTVDVFLEKQRTQVIAAYDDAVESHAKAQLWALVLVERKRHGSFESLAFPARRYAYIARTLHA